MHCSLKPTLKDALKEAVFSKDGIHSCTYHLLAGDLRDMPTLGEKVLSRNIDMGYTMLLRNFNPFYGSIQHQPPHYHLNGMCLGLHGTREIHRSD